MVTARPLSFAAQLKRLRRAAGLTQEQLAARAGFSVSYLGQLERGVRVPVRPTAELLAQALGLDPAGQAALLGALPAPAPPSAVAHDAPPAAPLVGRARELALLDRHLTGEGPPLLLLAGEPGIGKTRLLQEAARRGTERGLRVLRGGCTRRSGQEPYAPLLAALEGYVRGQTAAQLRGGLGGCAWLARLLPELLELGVAPAPAWTLPPEQERRLMFAAVGRFLANVAGPAGTLLVLDDLQWAGEDALSMLADVVHATSERPLRVVGAYRDTEAGREGALAAFLADLARERLAVHRTLAPLSPGEAAELLRQLMDATRSDIEPGTSPAMASMVLQRAGGVPYFLVSCTQALRAGAVAADGGREDVPWDVAQTIRQRVGALPSGAQDVVAVAAVIGRQVPRDVLLGVAHQLGDGQQALVAALEAAGRARLLVEAGEAVYRFPHDLIREAVLADLSAVRRADLHRRVAETIELGAGVASAGLLAHHYVRAGEGQKATVYLERAGDRSQALYANAEAEAYYRELVEWLWRLGRTGEAARAGAKLAAVLMTMARFDQALDVLERAALTCREVNDLERYMEISAQIGEVHSLRGTSHEGAARLRMVLDSIEGKQVPDASLAALYVAIAGLYFQDCRYRDQIEAARRGEELARTVQDLQSLGRAQVRRGIGLVMLGHMREGCAILETAIPVTGAAGDLLTLAYAFSTLSIAFQSMGEFALDRQYVERALETAESMENPMAIGFMLVRRAASEFYMAEWDQARADCERALALSREVGQSWTRAHPLILLGLLSMFEGREDAAADYLREGMPLAERNGDLVSIRWTNAALADRDLLHGRAEEARARLVPLLDRHGQEEALVTALLPGLAWAHLAMGEDDEAENLVAQAKRRAISADMRPALMEVWRVEALLATRRRRWHEAERALEEALTLSRTLRVDLGEARVLYTYGLLHVERGEVQAARARLTASLAILDRLGERMHAEHVERALAALGPP